jgi:predicted membrane metal-binding protein
MATLSIWTYPEEYLILGTTKIKEADDYLNYGQVDFQNWVNSTGAYVGVGLSTYIATAIDDAVSGIDTNAMARINYLFASFVEDTIVVEW